MRLPRKINGIWKPYNPADFRAYASRQRWFRTPNDAFMTGNFHVAASLLQKVMKMNSLAWFQLLLASTYSGSFHPTAEGHAAIADALSDKARTVLRKYGQASDPVVETFDPPPPPPVDEPLVEMPQLPPAAPAAIAPKSIEDLIAPETPPDAPEAPAVAVPEIPVDGNRQDAPLPEIPNTAQGSENGDRITPDDHRDDLPEPGSSATTAQPLVVKPFAKE